MSTQNTDTLYRGQVINFHDLFGFAKVTSPGDKNGEHIYISADQIVVEENTDDTEKNKRQFLVTGEYVQFNITKESDDKEFATNVTGVDGGELMCNNKYMRGTLIQYRKRMRTRRRDARYSNDEGAAEETTTSAPATT